MIKSTPGGVLFFFPSYAMLLKYFENWEEQSIADEMKKIKDVYIEPKQSKKYKNVISDYYQSIYKGKGAVLLAVCRGKIAEGLDFSDDGARCAVLIGVPNPNYTAIKTVLKKEYLEKCPLSREGAAKDWYE